MNSDAYELYLRGKFFAEKRTGADLRRSIEYDEQAIAKDPNYPLAYVGLADFICFFCLRRHFSERVISPRQSGSKESARAG